MGTAAADDLKLRLVVIFYLAEKRGRTARPPDSSYYGYGQIIPLMNQAAVSVLRKRRPDSLFLTTFRPGETLEKSCYDLLFPTTILTIKYPAKAGSIAQHLTQSDNKKSTKHRFFIDISWIFSGASSDTAFFENNRSTICF